MRGANGTSCNYRECVLAGAHRASRFQRLYLNPESASTCFQACTACLEKLRAHKIEAAKLSDVQALGNFDSGIASQRLSPRKRSGANNLVNVLQSHIDVVMQMQAVFQKFFTSTETVDPTNTQRRSGRILDPVHPPPDGNHNPIPCV